MSWYDTAWGNLIYAILEHGGRVDLNGSKPSGTKVIQPDLKLPGEGVVFEVHPDGSCDGWHETCIAVKTSTGAKDVKCGTHIGQFGGEGGYGEDLSCGNMPTTGDLTIEVRLYAHPDADHPWGWNNWK